MIFVAHGVREVLRGACVPARGGGMARTTSNRPHLVWWLHLVIFAFADERMPGPACMADVSGWGPGAAHPGRGPVICRRCLKLVGAVPPGEQLELFPAAGQDAPADGGDDAAGESP